MKKLILLLVLFLSACSGSDDIEVVKVENEVDYTRDIYLIETANDVSEIRSLHDKLLVHLAEEEEPVNVAIKLMDMSIAASDNSYKIIGTGSIEFDLIKADLKAIQSYVDEKYKLFSEQKELDRLALNETITKLSSLIDKLETNFESVK
ncbi:hypothetical protein [Psychrobacillus antarcticus]|uniref:hypothetical protein n=1 Tax=Psychrobacillus antarcticus TaxID=2879115 RepID=UPI00240823E8|nr:hypothetical protein [Psychrobacillus antarcticus]